MSNKRKPRKLCHSHAQRIHAKRRLKERFDIDFNARQRKALVRLIRDKKLIFVKRQSDRITHWKFTYDEKEIIAVYDSILKNVVTFLYSNWGDMFQGGDGALQAS